MKSKIIKWTVEVVKYAVTAAISIFLASCSITYIRDSTNVNTSTSGSLSCDSLGFTRLGDSINADVINYADSIINSVCDGYVDMHSGSTLNAY